jgi:hypothetical protein
LHTAIKLFNEKKLPIKIIDTPDAYKIKLSKKSGVPDLDLPGVRLDEKIKDANFFDFSIIIEDSHIIIETRKTFSDSPSSSLKSFGHGAGERLLDKTDSVLVKKRKCCCFYI